MPAQNCCVKFTVKKTNAIILGPRRPAAPPPHCGVSSYATASGTVLVNRWADELQRWALALSPTEQWGAWPPRVPIVYFFLVTSSSETHKLCVSDSGLYMVAYPEKNVLCFTHCAYFSMHSGFTVKIFSVNFLPLLARNPGDATGAG